MTEFDSEDEEISPTPELMKENEINDGASVNDKATT